MERPWTDEEGQKSLRELADYFNLAVLKAVPEDTAVQLPDGEIENIYRQMADEKVRRRTGPVPVDGSNVGASM